MNVGGATVRAYLKGLQDISPVSGATERNHQAAFHAVRECIRLAPALDAALDSVIGDPLPFGATE